MNVKNNFRLQSKKQVKQRNQLYATLYLFSNQFSICLNCNNYIYIYFFLINVIIIYIFWKLLLTFFVTQITTNLKLLLFTNTEELVTKKTNEENIILKRSSQKVLKAEKKKRNKTYLTVLRTRDLCITVEKLSPLDHRERYSRELTCTKHNTSNSKTLQDSFILGT